MSFFENTRKPTGFGGKLMVLMMNVGHRALSGWGLRFLKLAPDAKVLDCGCGGGANIRTLLKKCPKGIVKGIDYSAVSAEQARKRNADAIQAGRCAVWQGSVAVFCMRIWSGGSRTKRFPVSLRKSDAGGEWQCIPLSIS